VLVMLVKKVLHEEVKLLVNVVSNGWGKGVGSTGEAVGTTGTTVFVAVVETDAEADDPEDVDEGKYIVEATVPDGDSVAILTPPLGTCS